MISNRQVCRARWTRTYYGGAEESYSLEVPGPHPRVVLGHVRRKRRGESWAAWIDDRNKVNRHNREIDLGEFSTRGPAKHAVRRVVRSLPPAQRGDGRPSLGMGRRELAPTREAST